METISLSERDRVLLSSLVNELRRLNDSRPAETPDCVLSCSEAAKFLGKTRQTISRWLRDGRLRKVVRGGKAGGLLSEVKQIQNPFAI